MISLRLKLKLPESVVVWLHRSIPIIFLALVISIAGYELHQLDFHTIRMTLNALNPSSLAAVQLVAFVGMFVMGMYDWQALRAVSDDWLSKGKAAEKAYSLGAFSEVYLARSDIAVVTVNERIVAFASLMPDYARHRELSIDLMRHNENAPTGTMVYLFVNLICYAKEQNYTFFNLGMAPLSGVGDSPYARRVEKIARVAYEYGNRYYNCKGLRSFKQIFHPQWRSSYLAYPILTPLPALLVDIAALIAGSYRHIFFRTE